MTTPPTEKEIDDMLAWLDRHAKDEMSEHSRRVRHGFEEAAYIIRRLRTTSWHQQMEQRMAAVEQQVRSTAATVSCCPPHYILPNSPPSPAFPLPRPEKPIGE